MKRQARFMIKSSTGGKNFSMPAKLGRMLSMWNIQLLIYGTADNTRSLWKCDSCQTSIDSMGHVLWCPSYGDLRIGKNMHDDHDMARYLHDVMIIRSKLDLQR